MKIKKEVVIYLMIILFLSIFIFSLDLGDSVTETTTIETTDSDDLDDFKEREFNNNVCVQASDVFIDNRKDNKRRATWHLKYSGRRRAGTGAAAHRG